MYSGYVCCTYFYLFIVLCLCVNIAHIWKSREQLVGVGFLLSSCGPKGSNSDRQAQ